jgi:phage shock protein C
MKVLVMEEQVKRLQLFFQDHAFGVCSALGEKLGIASSSIRLFFIYASFLTLGSPIIVYLGLAFILNMRKHLRRSNSSVLDY